MFALALVTLLDGSQINVQIHADATLHLNTCYGELRIPVSQVREINLGAHVDNAATYTGYLATLGGDAAWAERDTAMKFFAANQRGAYKYLLKAKSFKDPEVVRRVELLLKEYTSAPALRDTVVTVDGSFQGEIQQLSLKCGSALGQLDIKLSTIDAIVFRLNRTITLHPGAWTTVGRVGGAVTIRAVGEVDLYPPTPGQYMSLPDGNIGYQVKDFHAGVLLGRIDGGAPFRLGAVATLRDLRRGVLEVSINASPWSVPAAGSYEVTVE